MKDFTFEEKNEKKKKKETIEWLRLWCEDTNNDSLPRVALIGDSITAQGHEVVKRELAGIATVDYLATSYSILSPAYKGMVEKFIEDSKYDLICYNYGLHALNVSVEEYEKAYKEMLKIFLERCKVIVSLTTIVHDKQDLNKESESTAPIVKERNVCAMKLAREFGLSVDDAYSVSVKLGKDGKEEDGIHFNSRGKEMLSVNKAQAIKKALGF